MPDLGIPGVVIHIATLGTAAQDAAAALARIPEVIDAHIASRTSGASTATAGMANRNSIPQTQRSRHRGIVIDF